MSNELKVIDWVEGQSLAGGSLELAKEVLGMFVVGLPKDLAKIDASYHQNDFSQMEDQIHYLFGAISYCGVPALKVVTKRLETALKQHNKEQIIASYTLFKQESERLLAMASSECLA